MQHTYYFREKPVRSGVESIPDGAICGNGDVAVILGNAEAGLRLNIAKCDSFLADENASHEGGIKPVGYVNIPVKGALYRHFYAEQRMDEGTVYCRFENGGEWVRIAVTVLAQRNCILIETDGSPADCFGKPSFVMEKCAEEARLNERVAENVTTVTRTFAGETLAFETAVSVAFRQWNKDCFLLTVDTNHDRADYETAGEVYLRAFSEELLHKEKQAHAAWWKHFWSHSEMTLSDKELECHWYASLYYLAVCGRNPRFAPGLYGNFITVKQPNWRGDYHLNYNYQAAFYAACKANHPELLDSYAAPLEDFLPRAKQYAKNLLHCEGVYYPTSIAPLGALATDTPESPWREEMLFLGQKSNAAYAAAVLLMRWNATRDMDYARTHVYPFLKEVGAFWESYLKKEKNRYVILDDAVHEVPYYRADFQEKKHRKEIHAKNNLLSLGLVRMVFSGLLELSKALNTDACCREKWEEILENLSEYPTFIRRAKRVFRYTEKGESWHTENFLCLQHCYPAGQIGLSSDKRVLKIARNTFYSTKRWFDGNATNSLFPCAVRLGLPPKEILFYLRENDRRFRLPNGLMNYGGGCLENCSTTANTIDEMALLSHEGVLRFFRVWDSSLDCSYSNLRADGAFLVSASITAGKIGGIRIVSEKGNTLCFENPFPICRVAHLGGSFVTDERLVTLVSVAQEVILLTREEKKPKAD